MILIRGGRGIGVGEIVDVLDEITVDVRWPEGRCYETIDQIKIKEII